MTHKKVRKKWKWNVETAFSQSVEYIIELCNFEKKSLMLMLRPTTSPIVLMEKVVKFMNTKS